MCLAIPAKIVAIDGSQSRVELTGNVIEADLTLVEGARVGDWVLVHAGFAIERLDEEDALETLTLFAQAEEASRGSEP